MNRVEKEEKNSVTQIEILQLEAAIQLVSLTGQLDLKYWECTSVALTVCDVGFSGWKRHSVDFSFLPYTWQVR